MRYLVVLFLAAFSLCEMVDEGVVLREMKTLSDLEKEVNVTFKGHLGMNYTISLPSTPSTGFLWTIKDKGEGVLKYEGKDEMGDFEDSECRIADGSGRQKFRFLAAEKGNASLVFENKRNYENATDVINYEVNMEILDPC
eukprot:TRINITY_DN1164_c0_g1_i1.p1 TRINITY_DN1164_c0_g1~~TRINITY_DN1164_c0_g1_i1.p1  ORF type:complete len:140 (-),score=44.55 TRINITY_DN1164_c0_g1_i1:155-574(-)